MKAIDMAIASIIGAALGVAITLVLINGRLSDIETTQLNSAPVAVLDFYSIAAAHPGGASSKTVNSEMSALKSKAEQLIDRGFVVLLSDYVYGAPEGIKIKTLNEVQP